MVRYMVKINGMELINIMLGLKMSFGCNEPFQRTVRILITLDYFLGPKFSFHCFNLFNTIIST